MMQSAFRVIALARSVPNRRGRAAAVCPEIDVQRHGKPNARTTTRPVREAFRLHPEVPGVENRSSWLAIIYRTPRAA